MPTPVCRRRLRWRGAEPATGLKLLLVAALAVSAAVLVLDSTALARPALPAGLGGLASAPVASLVPNSLAGLLPTAVPTVCVGGVVICGGTDTTPAAAGNPAAQPTPCLAGVLLCSPLPLPSNPVTGPTKTPGRTPGQPGTQPPPRGTTGRGAVGPAGPAGQALVGVALNAPLPAPPGVGLVPAARVSVDGGLAPDSFATVLSLSLRDGLGSGRYHVWPWLLAAQLALWTAIAAVVRFRTRKRLPEARRP